MLHWAWLLESRVWICTPWLEGRSWTTRYAWKVLASCRTALYPSSPGLGSGRVQYASRSVAGQCVSSATGVVPLVMLTLSLSMTKKGKVLKALWVVLLLRDPALCRPPQAVGHMWSSPVEVR